MPKGVLNPFYELAKEWVTEYKNSEPDDFTTRRFLRELSTLRKNGVDLGLARMAWRQLRSPEGIDGFSVPEATPQTVLKGRIPYWQQYKAWVLGNIPAVYLSSEHDTYVRQHSEALKMVGFVYRANRIPQEELEAMGVSYE